MLEKELIPVIDRVCEKLGRDSKAARLFMNCYPVVCLRVLFIIELYS